MPVTSRPVGRTLVPLAVMLLSTAPALARAEHRAEWLKKARWGVMVHYLPDWVDPKREWTSEDWNRHVDGVDVNELATQLKEVGAGYCLFAIGQNSGFYLSPNPVYDRLVGVQPSKCSRRDLVAELYEALQKRGIRLMVYLTAGPPHQDSAAVKALEWQGDGHRNREFQLRWEQVIREWSVRWGSKVSGWWFDGCSRPNIMYRSPEPPNFGSFAAAARAGSAASIVAFNSGMYYPILSPTPEEDYTAGLIYDFEREFVNRNRLAEGMLDGTQLQVLSFLGETWGRGSPRFSTDQVLAYTRKVLGYGGAITWEVPVQTNGSITELFMERLRAISLGLAADDSATKPTSTPSMP